MAPKSLAEQFADLDDPTPKGTFYFMIFNGSDLSAAIGANAQELTLRCDRLRPGGLGPGEGSSK